MSARHIRNVWFESQGSVRTTEHFVILESQLIALCCPVCRKVQHIVLPLSLEEIDTLRKGFKERHAECFKNQGIQTPCRLLGIGHS